jgi:hypothetical protein
MCTIHPIYYFNPYISNLTQFDSYNMNNLNIYCSSFHYNQNAFIFDYSRKIAYSSHNSSSFLYHKKVRDHTTLN